MNRKPPAHPDPQSRQGAPRPRKGLVSSLYNPFAAVPSMHVSYALIVGTSLAR